MIKKFLGISSIATLIYELLVSFQYFVLRNNTLSKLTETFSRSEYGTLQVRNNVRLTKLLADEEAAVVFSIDYLVGARYSPVSLTIIIYL